jgi:hypothetical protein
VNVGCKPLQDTYVHTWWPLGPWNLSNCLVPTSCCLASLSIPIPTTTIPWPTFLAILANFPFIALQCQAGLIYLHCSSPPKLANYSPSITTTLPTIVTLSMDFPLVQWPTFCMPCTQVWLVRARLFPCQPAPLMKIRV